MTLELQCERTRFRVQSKGDNPPVLAVNVRLTSPTFGFNTVLSEEETRADLTAQVIN